MNGPRLDFAPSVFYRVLAATLTLILVGWVVSLFVYGELATRDIVGSLICAPIFAYLVHLWIIYAREDANR
ncbi:MAG: hypothetical protein DHS20C16_31830 [Phycisphaerae bacterium]|nr:MAG: hypothetical protein DHS20C16_31830 [Phycisphaerae bacterium]